MKEEIIKRKGNYRDLLCYRKAETIYDLTYFFANKFLKISDRTIDQRATLHQQHQSRANCSY